MRVVGKRLCRAVGLMVALGVSAGSAQTLSIVPLDTPPQAVALAPSMPGQLPHSTLARGTRDIAAAWLAAPTGRYAHGVLGDALEAGVLAVDTRDGTRLRFVLPARRVFEDLVPRLVDLDGDGRDEIVVVESDRDLGASLAVFGLVDGALQRRAASPFIGRAKRWLNPLGAGDFDADGRLELAAVITPHIGGILRLYRFTPPTLSAFAETGDVSTHAIGSTALAMGHVLAAVPRALMLVPDQAHRRLRLLAWDGGWSTLATEDLPGRQRGALVAIGEKRWRGHSDGGGFAVELAP